MDGRPVLVTASRLADKGDRSQVLSGCPPSLKLRRTILHPLRIAPIAVVPLWNAPIQRCARLPAFAEASAVALRAVAGQVGEAFFFPIRKKEKTGRSSHAQAQQDEERDSG
jgi:hypothetical protein